MKCQTCYGSGKQVEREEYKGLTVISFDNEVYVEELDSHFPTLKGAKHAIDSVENDMKQFNSESAEEDRFSTLKEYCEEYLRELY